MKKLLVVFFLLIAFACFGQTEIFYNEHPTLTWDAVTVDADGNPFLPEDVIEYEVYIFDSAGGVISEQPISNLIPFGTFSVNECVISFPYRANWAVAVNVKVTNGDGAIAYGPLGYSTEAPPVTDPGPFVYAPNGLTLPKVQGLQDSGIY